VLSSNRFFLRAATALAVLAAGTVQPAWATTPTIPYGNPGTYNPVDVIFSAAATGDIIATFIGKSNALYENQVGLLDNGILTGAGFGLDNRTSTTASTFDMGLVQKGDTLTFVMDNITLGEYLYSNASMNAAYDLGTDTLGHNHVYASPYYNPTYTYVGFEDQRFPTADFNYNDSAFLFTDVAIAPTVPEPQSAALLFVGLAAFGALARRRRG
jgi:hypothetical protein